MKGPVQDAEPDEMAPVEGARGEVTKAIEALKQQEVVTPKDVEGVQGLVLKVGEAINTAKAKVQERLKKAAGLALLDVTSDDKLGKNPEGVLPKREKALNEKRAAAKKALETQPLTAALVKEGETARDDLRKLMEEAGKDVVALGGKEEVEKLQAALGGQAQLEKLQDAFGVEDPTKLKDLVADFGGPATLKTLAAYKSDPTELKKVCDNLGGAKCVSTLLVEGCGGKTDKLEALQSAFAGDFTKLGGMLKTGGLEKHPKALAALVKTGCKGNPDDFKTLCDNYTDPTALANLADLLDKGGLGAKPDCLGQMLAVGCADETNGVKGSAAKLQAVAKGVKDANLLPKLQELVGVKANGAADPDATGGLGDNPEVFGHLVATGCGKDPDKLKTLLATFDATGVKNLNTLVKDGGFGKHQVEDPLGSGTQVDVVKPEALGKLLSIGCAGNPGDLKTVCQTLSGSGAGLKGLKSLMQSGGLGAKPDCLGQLLAIGVKDDAGVAQSAGKLNTMLQTLDDPGLHTKMQSLLGVKANGVADPTVGGGLGDNPEVFGHLVATGCEKDPTKVKTLLEKFDAPGLKNLNLLVKDGGFAKHPKDDPTLSVQPPTVVKPECLAKLLTVGCQGDPEKLQTLGNTLSANGRIGLQGLMQKGGLGVRPDCLGQLVATGLEDPNMAVSAGKLDTLAQTLNTTQYQGKMQGLLGVKTDGQPDATLEGGLGDNYEVFGHLIGTGCEKDPAKVKTLLDKFDATALTGLNELVKGGGFASHKIETGKRVKKQVEDPPGSGTMVDAVDPKCLGKLLETGCEKKPEELAKLVNALNDSDRGNLQKTMEEGRLGARPAVLGNSYKFGCLTDPYDPASEKKPAMLKELATAFGNTTDAPKQLRELLEEGGLGDETNHPEWLGKVMRDAFTNRPPNPPNPPPVPSGKVQDPKQLKNLHAAFSGNMPQLKTMIDAMGTMPPSCGVADEPGKALQNVHVSANVPIDKLQNQFYTKLYNCSLAPHGLPPSVGGNPPAAKLTLTALIQNAASFEFDNVGQAPKNLGTRLYETDMDHITNRHCRRAPYRWENDNNNVSFFPKNAEQPQVEAIVAASINNCNAGKVFPSTCPVRPHDPPQTQSDLNTNGKRQYKNVSGNGYTGTVGFRRKGGGGYNPGGPVKTGQYYPTGGPDVVTMNATDLHEIKAALNK
jgi:hypothetical protein